jgi:hypothetical protein
LIFCVANPPPGAQTATVSWTNTINGADVGVITVSGADPTTPCTNGTFLAGNSLPVTTSVTITSATGDLTATVAYTNDAWVAPYTNQTLKWGLDSGLVGGDIGPGSGTTTHTWTDQWPLNAHAVSGANFKAAIGFDFTLSASPSSRTVTAGTSTSYGVTITPFNGFNDAVTLSASGLPAGAGGTFTPNPATTSSTLSVTTSASTPAGNYPVTISGVNGSLTRTTTVTLVVMHGSVAFDNAVSSGLRWQPTTATTPSVVISNAPNRAAMIMVTMPDNVATGITASLGGVSGTLIPGTDSGTTAGVRTLIFCVANPPSGAQTATVSWTNSVLGTDVAVIAATGVDQTTPCTNGTFLAGNSRPVTTSVTIASTAGDLTASVANTTGGWVAPFTNQTLKWGVDAGVIGGDIGPGTGTTMHAWTDQWALNAHAVSGANFKAAP